MNEIQKFYMEKCYFLSRYFEEQGNPELSDWYKKIADHLKNC